VDDTCTIVEILIASKEASFPDTADDHDRDVDFWTDRWHGYITRGSLEQSLQALLHETRRRRDPAGWPVGDFSATSARSRHDCPVRSMRS
jgi:hypothetical protein